MSLYHKGAALYVSEITLNVLDLDAVSRFYQDKLFLKVLHKENDTLAMGYQFDKPILRLNQVLFKENNHKLYHFALLVPNEITLSILIQNILRQGYPLDGAADHGISDAVYLKDPEGNGIEIYIDKNPTYWKDVKSNLQKLENKPFDYRKYIDMAPDKPDLEDIILGHIHLHTNRFESMKHFYQTVLKFEDIISLSNVSFLSTVQYHHHIAINTWHQIQDDAFTLGLQKITLSLKNDIDRKQLIKHIQNNVESEIIDQSLYFKDPNDTIIELALK